MHISITYNVFGVWQVEESVTRWRWRRRKTLRRSIALCSKHRFSNFKLPIVNATKRHCNQVLCSHSNNTVLKYTIISSVFISWRVCLNFLIIIYALLFLSRLIIYIILKLGRVEMFLLKKLSSFWFFT